MGLLALTVSAGKLGELAGHRVIRHGGGINGFSTMIALSRRPAGRHRAVQHCRSIRRVVADRIAKVMLGIEDEPDDNCPGSQADR